MILRNSVSRNSGKLLIATGLILSIAATSPVDASVTSPSPVDTSNAVRWDPDGSPIGDVVYEFVNEDDRTKRIEAPFPLNFFGTRLPALCLSTNGLVYPLASVNDSCSAAFDRSLEGLTLQSRSSAIAALALDLDLSEKIHNPQRESTEELQITSVHVASNVVTVTTHAAHGFRIGDYLERSINPSFTGSSFGRRVLTVPSPTTFTVDNTASVADGTYAPAAGDRAVVFREVVFARVSTLSLSGTTLTVTTTSDAHFGVGGKFTFASTGIPSLDNGKFVVASRVSNNTFTVTVPVNVTDVDPTQTGDQTTWTPSTNRPWALERDEVGAIQQVYFGTTTVDGRDAYSVTWYRTGTNDYQTNGINGGRFPAVNPETLSITLQLLIVKRSTGSNATGWDFDYEVNIGHATDASDGYRSDNPINSCSTSSLADLELCRWGIGIAQILTGPGITSVSSDGTAITINTSAPHNLSVGRLMRLENCCTTRSIDSDVYRILSVVDADTFTVADIWASAFADEPAPAGARLNYAESWELFPNTSVLGLRDAGGSTALIRNSLNSTVLGRYTFGSVNGQIVQFVTPTMGAGISGTVAAPATTTTTTAAAATTTTPLRVTSRELPATGSDVNYLLLLSLVALTAGGILLRRTRPL